MNEAQYKLLMSNLPAMASVVNSFSSPEVQLAVYQTLIAALEQRTEAKSRAATYTNPPARTGGGATAKVASDQAVLTHDLLDGDSIHALTTVL